jgi:hypothetical protein
VSRVVSEMRGKFNVVSDSLKKTDRRLETLGEHIKHSENFKAYRGYKAKYDKLYTEYLTVKKSGGLFAERKAQKALDAANAYYEANRRELTLFDAAERYLKGVLQSRYDSKKLPPIAEWRKEQSAKSAERAALYQDYEKLKNETLNVEQMKQTVEQIIREQEPGRERPTERKRNYDIGL